MSFKENFPSYHSIVGNNLLRTIHDDAVSINTKNLSISLTITIGLWLMSYVLIQLHIIDNDHMLPFIAWLFIPQIIGSIIGILSILFILHNICQSLTLQTEERRQYLENNNNNDVNNMIDYQSLPLLRQILLWSLILFVFFVCILLTQVLMYLFIVRSIGLWEAMSPVLIITFLLLSYLFVIDTLSISSISTLSLLVLGLVFFTMKYQDTKMHTITSFIFDRFGSIIVTVPFFAVKIIWIRELIGLQTNSSLLLTKRQSQCLLFYITSMMMMIVGNVLTVVLPHSIIINYVYLVAIPMFVITALCILNDELHDIAFTRGFHQPAVPSRDTNNNWVLHPTSHKSLLLGTISITNPNAFVTTIVN